MAGTHYYVDNLNGTDSVGFGTSPGSGAVATIGYLLAHLSDDPVGTQINLADNAAHTLSGSLDYTTFGAPTINGNITWRGYTSTANDGGVATIDGASTYSLTGSSSVVSYVNFVDLIIQNLAHSSGWSAPFGYATILNVRWINCTGVVGGGNAPQFINCSFEDFPVYAGIPYALHFTGVGLVSGCFFRNNTRSCINLNGAAVTARDNILAVNNGYNGIVLSGAVGGVSIVNNSLLGVSHSTGDAIQLINTSYQCDICNNLIEGFTGGYVVNQGVSTRTRDNGILANNSYYNCSSSFNYTSEVICYEGNESLGSTPFAKSGSITFANRETYFAPQDVGSVFGGSLHSNRDRGAVQGAGSGSGGGFPTRLIGGGGMN